MTLRFLLGHIDAREDLGGFGDAGQALRQGLRGQVIQVQVDVVLATLWTEVHTEKYGGRCVM